MSLNQINVNPQMQKLVESVVIDARFGAINQASLVTLPSQTVRQPDFQKFSDLLREYHE